MPRRAYAFSATARSFDQFDREFGTVIQPASPRSNISKDVSKKLEQEFQRQLGLNAIKNEHGEVINLEQLFNNVKWVALQQYQDLHNSNPKNHEILFLLMRELNRNGKYDEVINLWEENVRPSRFLMFMKTDAFAKEIEDQHQYAEAKRGEKLTRSRGYESSTSQGISLWKIVKWSVIGYFVYLYFFSSEEGDGDFFIGKKEDEKMPQGIISNLFGKFVEGEETNVPTRFSDVLGIDEFKEELQELVDYLKNPTKYTSAGAKIPKGILLVGDPGTGKTLLARALAGEAGCAFFYKAGSEFDEMLVGLGARRVRELFKKARAKAPAIIFIDEIDSLAGKRSPLESPYARETINQILAEMDGFKQTDNIIVIGATNLEEALDPAVKRPGRFDKIIHLPRPDVKGREELFKYYLSKIKVESVVSANTLARQTTAMTGADIQNITNIAILNAVKNSRRQANKEDFEFAIDRVSMGIGRKHLMVEEKHKLMTAYHEGGHALVALLVEGSLPLHKITILPRGPALGFTAMLPHEDEHSQDRQKMLASIDVAMGGRVAEELIYGSDDLTTGCFSDMKGATDLAYTYVRSFGMAEGVSLIAMDKKETSDKFNFLIDQEVERILKDSFERVKVLLKNNQGKLKKLAGELVKKETMTAEEVRKLLGL